MLLVSCAIEGYINGQATERKIMLTAAPTTYPTTTIGTSTAAPTLPSRAIVFGEAFDSGMRTLLHNWARGTSSYECTRVDGAALVTVTISYASDEEQEAFRFTLRSATTGEIEQRFMVVTHPHTAIERFDASDRRLFPIFRQPRDLWSAEDLKNFIEAQVPR
jgi:hypothetical protein